ncbi:MAG: hypothetical protein Q9213_005497 [Squamulea squamosa]
MSSTIIQDDNINQSQSILHKDDSEGFFKLPVINPIYTACNPIYTAYKSRKPSFRQKQKAARRARERIDNAPKPLPTRRPRSLSSLPQNLQRESLLLSRLPLELRQEIYTYVIGGSLVHVLRKGKHLAHVRCKRQTETDFERYCRPHASYTCHSGMSTLGSTANGNIALLRTCRQVYVEAVEIMYAQNTFEFDHQDLFLLFSWNTLPQRLETIRHLHLNCREDSFSSSFFKVEFGSSSWIMMWQHIKEDMPGLKHLRVRILGEQGSSHPSEDRWWVTPMLQLRGLKTFQLEYCAPSNNWVQFGDGVLEMSRFLEERIRTAVCS